LSAIKPAACRERQLDDTGVERLYLFHLSLDAHLDNGETLASLVDDLRDSLRSTAVGPVFDERLLEAGFLNAHRHHYENPGYTVRESNFFRVTEGFPCIVEKDLRSGVGDVHYSVAVAECKHFLVEAETAMGELGGNDVNS
jgi:hypothetical protein